METGRRHAPARSLRSAFILRVSSWATFRRCSVYSCRRSSRAASSFRGFLDAGTFREGRTSRLWSIMAEASLGGGGG